MPKQLPTFRIAHISDLHFSQGMYRADAKSHCHSVELLVAASRKLAELKPDYLVVSGDITNNGDPESMLRFQDWLFREAAVGGGEKCGLNFPPDRVGVIPGNHDAWDSSGSGPYRLRWQRSLQNYNGAFPLQFRIPEGGAYYHWIEHEGICLLLVYLDSSYLSTIEDHVDGTPLDKIARGKISMSQSDLVLRWFDQGVKGTLPQARGAATMVDPVKFCGALKVVVMHHYVIPIPAHPDGYFMDLQHRDVVLRNLVMAGTDMVLCGHKHVPKVTMRRCGQHFDRRAKSRYLVNMFRREIGLPAAALRYDERKRPVSRLISWVLDLWIEKRFTAEPDGIFLDGLLDALLQGLNDPEGLRVQITALLGNDVANVPPIGRHESMEMQNHVLTQLRPEQRRRLTAVLGPMMRSTLRQLDRRPIVQAMSGSTTKASASLNAVRAFATYDVSPSEDGSSVTVRFSEWRWNAAAGEFASFGRRRKETFPTVVDPT